MLGYSSRTSRPAEFYVDFFGFPVVKEFGSGGAKIALIDIGRG